MEREGTAVTCDGRFHRRAATTGNGRSPYWATGERSTLALCLHDDLQASKASSKRP